MCGVGSYGSVAAWVMAPAEEVEPLGASALTTSVPRFSRHAFTRKPRPFHLSPRVPGKMRLFELGGHIATCETSHRVVEASAGSARLVNGRVECGSGVGGFLRSLPIE